MTHTLQLTLPEHTYKALATTAAAYNLTPEELLQSWLEEKLESEQEAIRYDDAFHHDPDWIEGAHKAFEQANSGQGKVYHSTEEFLQALDEIRCECGDADANV